MEMPVAFAPALAVGTVRAPDLAGAVEPGSVQHRHILQTAALAQLGGGAGENREEARQFDRIEHGTDLTVARDFVDAGQRLAIPSSTRGLQMALAGKAGWASHEKWRKRRQSKVGDGI